MTAKLKHGCRVIAPVLAMLLGGCAVSSNPFKFGNLPAKDIRRNHAKPSNWGYYGNFDPKAHCIQVAPAESINPVRRQHVLVASVCDEEGNGLRNRRIEWHVSGVGHIVEVDESGHFAGRGYLVDDKYAVSYTNYKPHTLTRGNNDPADDIHLKPGQSWIVITSAEEGDTHVTCYAPGIYNWDKHKVFAVKHWIDAEPVFPPPAVNAVGTPHTLATRVVRISDKTAAMGYRVRYRILDGPPAILEPGGAPFAEIQTDHQGNGSVVLRQAQPAPGVNRIAIDVVRPPEKPGGRELVIATYETTKTWVSPNIAIQKMAPPTAMVGAQIPFQIVVTNNGTIGTQGGKIRDTLVEALALVSATPAAERQGPNLSWNFPPLLPGQSYAVQFVCTATAPGVVNNCAEAIMAEGPSGRACATTQIVTAGLAITKTGPPAAIVGQPVTFQITVSNPGGGPATNVVITDAFDVGFLHETGSAPVQMPIGNLNPGESRVVPITLQARQVGRLRNQVTATAAGGLTAVAEAFVDVAQPAIAIKKTGPRIAYVGAPVEFEVAVQNTGPIPCTNVVLRDVLPPEFTLQGAPVGGTIQGNAVAYAIGTLQPGEKRTLKLQAIPNAIGSNLCNVAEVTADGGLRAQDQACVEVRGVPAIGTELVDRLDPVPIGGETTYTIRITNQGSMPANDVVLTCRMPEGLDFVDAEGAVKHSYDANSRILRFEAFPSMAPRRQLLYQVQAKGTRAGDWRFELQIRAKELSAPVTVQESTRVYDPNNPDLSRRSEPAPLTAPASAPVSAPVSGEKGGALPSPEATPAKPATGRAPSEGSTKPAGATNTAPAANPEAPAKTAVPSKKPAPDENDKFEIPLPPIPPLESDPKEKPAPRVAEASH